MLKHVKIQKSYEQHFSIWHVYHDVEWDIIEYAIEAVAPHNAIFTEKCLLLMCKLVERKKKTNSGLFPTAIAYSKIMLQLLFDIFNLMNQFFGPFYSRRLLYTLSSQSTKHLQESLCCKTIKYKST